MSNKEQRKKDRERMAKIREGFKLIGVPEFDAELFTHKCPTYYNPAQIHAWYLSLRNVYYGRNANAEHIDMIEGVYKKLKAVFDVDEKEAKEIEVNE